MNASSIASALRLLELLIDAGTICEPENSDLIGEDGGALNAAVAALKRDDVAEAVERLNAAVLLAAQPLAPSAPRHVIKKRAHLLRVAKSARQLLRLGIKAKGGAA